MYEVRKLLSDDRYLRNITLVKPITDNLVELQSRMVHGYRVKISCRILLKPVTPSLGMVLSADLIKLESHMYNNNVDNSNYRVVEIMFSLQSYTSWFVILQYLYYTLFPIIDYCHAI